MKVNFVGLEFLKFEMRFNKNAAFETQGSLFR